MVELNVESHNMCPTFYRFTSLLFHVNRLYHSWDTVFSKFDLENPMPRSWVRWTLKVTTWVQHPIDSHRFYSMSMGPPIPEIQHFQNFTLKVQGQGHSWRPHSRYQNPINISLPFRVDEPSHSYIYSYLKIWHWKSKVKFMVELNVESHNMCPAFYRLTSLFFVLCQAAIPLLRYRIFKIWPHDDVIKWKHFPRNWPFVRGIHRSPVNSPHKGQWRRALMFSLICVWINGGVNNREAGDLRRYRAHYDVTVMLKIQGQGHGWDERWKSQHGSTHIPFVPCQSALPFLRYSIFKIWRWKSKFKVIWPWCCTNRGLDNSIELQMVYIHPVWTQFVANVRSFWSMDKPIWGNWANDHDSAQLQA